jgi:hypothetical protein
MRANIDDKIDVNVHIEIGDYKNITRSSIERVCVDILRISNDGSELKYISISCDTSGEC